jgi:hypothetical protein
MLLQRLVSSTYIELRKDVGARHADIRYLSSIIARPGPYANAETNAGGLALWTSDGSAGTIGKLG